MGMAVTPPLPDKKYNIIYADCPWEYDDGRTSKSAGMARSAYETMPLQDICNLPVSAISARDCMLFLWGTWPKLPEALKVMEAWGFTYRTCAFVWIKLNPGFTTDQNYSIPRHEFYSGLGHWTNSGSEFVLMGRKGDTLPRERRDIKQVIAYPRLRHSEKPSIFRDKIVDLLGDLPRIELFARSLHLGWDAWGNEL